ncbi:tartrate-resistant acid phosphatase type 5-like [Sycon ciliatum]|uniref:tartrate-resistant acid phosphatase type 5-like n=1 Tax=Sycon ciliatum TaxID=27933 RepID=UPI0020ABD128|eukprot:scpid54431/ scgid7322/ Tartrate-resistant acid phosphatase type 5; Tartrate-resistant acid ATPase; Type 5 acid phosphatase
MGNNSGAASCPRLLSSVVSRHACHLVCIAVLSSITLLLWWTSSGMLPLWATTMTSGRLLEPVEEPPRATLLHGGLASAIAPPCLARSSKATSELLVIGDWGGRGRSPYMTPVSRAVGVVSGQLAQALSAVAVLSPGDAFYPSGVKKVNDFRFRVTFEEQFSHPSLQIPWYMALGNHDYEGKLKPLMEYGKTSRRWNLPSLYYSHVFSMNLSESSSVTYQILFLDTNRLVRQFKRLPERDSDQWDWISDQLASSTADWIFAVGHHPIYSVADRGTNPILVQELLPLLDRHGVALYFSGHDHNLQHVRTSNHSVEMFVVGAGSYTTASMAHKATVPIEFLKFHSGAWQRGGIASVSVGGCASTVTLHHVNPTTNPPSATIAYSYTVANPRKRPACCVPET